MQTIVIHKIDLDTVLATLLYTANKPCTPLCLSGSASSAQLRSRDYVCIECGGSGQIDRLNFDHHHPDQFFPPACRQVYDYFQQKTVYMDQLVTYACEVDECRCQVQGEHPSLSNMFSGMLLTIPDNPNRLRVGQRMLHECITEEIDPYSISPLPLAWLNFHKAKIDANENLAEDMRYTKFYTTARGSRIGYLQSQYPGGSKTLYNRGCDIVILHRKDYPRKHLHQYTIGTQYIPLAEVIEAMNKREEGWGGRANIIGSPYVGSELTPATVIQTVIKSL